MKRDVLAFLDARHAEELQAKADAEMKAKADRVQLAMHARADLLVEGDEARAGAR